MERKVIARHHLPSRCPAWGLLTLGLMIERLGGGQFWLGAYLVFALVLMLGWVAQVLDERQVDLQDLIK